LLARNGDDDDNLSVSTQRSALNSPAAIQHPAGVASANNSRVFFIAAAIFLAAGFCIQAAQPDLPKYFLRTWRTDDGLPDNAVTAVTQTRDGYLWIGTYGGLARFDGLRFRVFNNATDPGLQSDRITSLYEDAEGAMWIGHERGDLTCYRKGKFEAEGPRVTCVRRKISAIGSDRNGDIWLLNEQGTLVRARDGATCALPNHDGVVQMAQTSAGDLWVASGGKVARLEGGRLLPPTKHDSTNALVNFVQGICPSQDGGLWIAGDGRVRKWNGHDWTEDRGSNPTNSTLPAMMETRSGCVALGTVDSGLYLLFPNGVVRHFSQADGFPHDWIRCLSEDREGTLWVGAGSDGLVALHPGKVETLNPPDRFQGRVALSTTAARNGAIWVGTEGAGLYRYQDGQWNRFGLGSGLASQFVWSVSEDLQGRIWAGTWGGGMFMQEGDHFIVPPGLENVNAPMLALLHAPDGVTWIGTENGLLRYDNGSIAWFGQTNRFSVADVRAIARETNGTIWFGTLGGGLGRLQNGAIKHFGKSDGLASDYIQCLHMDTQDALWIGTYGSGLSRFKNGSFVNIGSAQGLPNNFISDIEDDGYGDFWISSHGGIFRVSKVALDGCADGKTASLNYLTYGKGDGMPSVECSGGFQPAAAHAADGRIGFPTSRGIVMVDPEHARVNRLEPLIVIEEVIANGRVLADNPDADGSLKLPAGSSRIEFHYTGLSFIAPDKMRFRYQLEGWEHDWVDAGSKRVAEYSYIPPGKYTFHVRACNSDAVWNESGVSLPFTLLPLFWQTIWFQAAVTLAAVGFVAGSVLLFTRRRMRRKLEVIQRQQAVERERTRIARDIHDHLGANLTRISLLSQSAQGELANPVQAALQLDRIYDTALELTRALGEIVWAVNPRHDTLDSLANYLGNFAQEFLVPINIRCRLDVPLQLPPWPITAEVRHNVFLAFKEGLHNIVKHSGATEVSVALQTNDRGFTLAVHDNGRGFDVRAVESDSEPLRPGRGNGLKNIRQRLQKIGGRSEIRSSPGAGTQIKFFVPTPEAQKTI
jgi:signal transduction histidine kinase/ligand-binding sensor domain-containing protein